MKLIASNKILNYRIQLEKNGKKAFGMFWLPLPLKNICILMCDARYILYSSAHVCNVYACEYFTHPISLLFVLHAHEYTLPLPICE